MNEIDETTQPAADDSGYIIHIDNFNGPLDLLWDLIKKAKIDITEVSISIITEQYLDFLREMERMNVRIATDFIRMASELLYYKSCALLPTAQIEDEYFVPPLPPELVQKLLEFKKFQNASRRLLDEFEANANKFSRQNSLENFVQPEDLNELSLFDLLKAFAEVMESLKTVEQKEIIFDEILVSDRIEHIKNILREREIIQFTEIFSRPPSRIEIVATFLAVLELVRTRFIKVMQHATFGIIRIMRNNGKSE